MTGLRPQMLSSGATRTLRVALPLLWLADAAALAGLGLSGLAGLHGLHPSVFVRDPTALLAPLICAALAVLLVALPVLWVWVLGLAMAWTDGGTLFIQGPRGQTTVPLAVVGDVTAHRLFDICTVTVRFAQPTAAGGAVRFLAHGRDAAARRTPHPVVAMLRELVDDARRMPPLPTARRPRFTPEHV